MKAHGEGQQTAGRHFQEGGRVRSVVTGGFQKGQIRSGKKTPSLHKVDSKPGLMAPTLWAVTKPQNLGKVEGEARTESKPQLNACCWHPQSNLQLPKKTFHTVIHADPNTLPGPSGTALEGWSLRAQLNFVLQNISMYTHLSQILLKCKQGPAEPSTGKF